VTIRLLHVHASESYHDDAYLVMNRSALNKLRQMLDTAIASGHIAIEFTPKDGETYPLHIVLDDSDWQSDSWQKRAIGYVDDTTHHCQGEDVWPMSEFGCYDAQTKRIVK